MVIASNQAFNLAFVITSENKNNLKFENKIIKTKNYLILFNFQKVKCCFINSFIRKPP